MAARKIVLLVGFGISVVGFIAVLLAAIFLLVPGINISGVLPIKLIMGLIITGLVGCFVGVVLAVAGANTKKSMAKFAFFLDTVAFIVAAAFLVIILFFKTVIPFPALERMAQDAILLLV